MSCFKLEAHESNRDLKHLAWPLGRYGLSESIQHRSPRSRSSPHGSHQCHTHRLPSAGLLPTLCCPVQMSCLPSAPRGLVPLLWVFPSCFLCSLQHHCSAVWILGLVLNSSAQGQVGKMLCTHERHQCASPNNFSMVSPSPLSCRQGTSYGTWLSAT